MEARKPWANATAYFESLVSDIETYQSNSRVTAKRSQYKSTSNGREDEQEEEYLQSFFYTLAKATTSEK